MREVEPNVSLILGGLETTDSTNWEPLAPSPAAVEEEDE